jgi:hypothetical protein
MKNRPSQLVTRSIPLIAARVLAATQGLVWFVFLIFGGIGLLFGPIALVAAAIGGRTPALSAILLVGPVAWLLNSWAPILSDGAGLGDWAVFASLVAPATLSALAFLGVAMNAMSSSPRWNAKGS